MHLRTDLHEALIEILGSSNVYFQPPETVKLAYPCIIYELDDISVRHADNVPYLSAKKYKLTVIDSDPDSAVPDNLRESLFYCPFDRFYTADNLNHWVFNLYY